MISLARGIGRTVAESGSIQALRRHRGRTTSTAGESLIIQLLRSTFRTTIALGMTNFKLNGTKGNWRGQFLDCDLMNKTRRIQGVGK